MSLSKGLSILFQSVQFSSVTQSCPTLCDPMNCSTPGLPVHHQLPEFTQTHVHRVSDAIQPSHHLSSPSPPAPNPSQHQSLFQGINSLHEVGKVLEFQLQHHSFQRNPRADLRQNGLVGSPCSPRTLKSLLQHHSWWCGVESPLDYKEIQPDHSDGDQPWDFFGRNDAKAETPVLWPPPAKG